MSCPLAVSLSHTHTHTHTQPSLNQLHHSTMVHLNPPSIMHIQKGNIFEVIKMMLYLHPLSQYSWFKKQIWSQLLNKHIYSTYLRWGSYSQICQVFEWYKFLWLLIVWWIWLMDQFWTPPIKNLTGIHMILALECPLFRSTTYTENYFCYKRSEEC